MEKAATSTEVQAEEVKTLRKDWATWRNALIVNSCVSLASFGEVTDRLIGVTLR